MTSLNYANISFAQLVAQLQQRLAEKATWQDTYRSSTGETLIELFSYVGELLNYNIERRAQELYIATARNKSSLINIAKLLNYEPRRKVGATGTLRFSVSSAAAKNIIIPKYTSCQTNNGVEYITIQSAVILAGGTSVDVPAIQGTKKTITITANGVANQEYSIDSTIIENTGISILIDGIEWTSVDSFVNSSASSTHYRITNNMDETVTIIFGDGVKGRIPSSINTITIIYIETLGQAGNTYSTGAINTINDTIYDEDDEIISSISVANTTTFLTGDDSETAEDIRYFAPKVFATGDRAVTRNDFITILKNYPGIADANVWGEKEEAELAGVSADVTMLNKVKICMILDNWYLPDTELTAALETYLYSLSMMAIKYEWVTAEIINVVPKLDVWINSAYSISTTQDEIEAALATKFVLGTTSTLGSDIDYSNLVAAVDDLDGVHHHNMILEIRELLTENGADSGYDYGAILSILDVLPESVGIYINDELIASDDGEGNFTAVSSNYPVTGGAINYTTGSVNINITSSEVAGEDVVIKYQQNENRNLVSTDRQIFKLYDVVFNSIQSV